MMLFNTDRCYSHNSHPHAVLQKLTSVTHNSVSEPDRCWVWMSCLWGFLMTYCIKVCLISAVLLSKKWLHVNRALYTININMFLMFRAVSLIHRSSEMCISADAGPLTFEWTRHFTIYRPKCYYEKEMSPDFWEMSDTWPESCFWYFWCLILCRLPSLTWV